MTLKNLILSHNWQNVSVVFADLYPEETENIEEYKTVYEKLLAMPMEKTDLSIVISKEKDDKDMYIDVSGLHNHPETEEDQYPQGIELMPWKDWLGMGISPQSLKDFSEMEIIVHCLYEMTFAGFSENEIQVKIDDMEKRRQERKSISEEERDAMSDSVEKILKSWRNNKST